MERMLTTEEKIRRAEEIYNRRQNQNYKRTTATVNVNNKKEIKLFRKMTIQICICLLIYAVFYIINNKEYIFSQAVLQKSREILSYDINIKEMYQWGKDFTTTKFVEIQGYLQNIDKETENKSDTQNIVNNEGQENQENTEGKEDTLVENNEQINSNSNEKINEDKTDEKSENSNTENIGGAVDEEEKTSSTNQMKIDAEEIKKSINLIKPLEGTITSRFGVRNPTVSTVSKYHTGIDIAANKGTKIKSASAGIVELASSEGDYGNHLKIKNGNLIFIYAHCNKLYVKQGDTIKQGQEIAEVGSTREFYWTTSAF